MDGRERSRGLLAAGIGGSAVAAVCCATPVLPWALGAAGLGALVPVVARDAVLLPVLAIFLAMTGVALWRRRG